MLPRGAPALWFTLSAYGRRRSGGRAGDDGYRRRAAVGGLRGVEVRRVSADPLCPLVALPRELSLAALPLDAALGVDGYISRDAVAGRSGVDVR